MKTSLKQNQKGFALLELVLIVLVVAAIGFGGWFVWHSRNSKNNAMQLNQTAANNQSLSNASQLSTSSATQIATIKGVQVKHSSYYSLKIGSSQYLGQVQKIDNDYVRLSPVYYDKGNTLIQLGNELHAPEPAMYIQVSNLASISELAASDGTYQAIQTLIKTNGTPTLQDVYPSGDIAQYIKSSDYQALFFTDGKTYFAHLGSLNGGGLFANTAEVFTIQSNTATVSLVKVSPAQLSSYTVAQLEFWENLKSTGQVSTAINTFLKSNP